MLTTDLRPKPIVLCEMTGLPMPKWRTQSQGLIKWQSRAGDPRSMTYVVLSSLQYRCQSVSEQNGDLLKFGSSRGIHAGYFPMKLPRYPSRLNLNQGGGAPGCSYRPLPPLSAGNHIPIPARIVLAYSHLERGFTAHEIDQLKDLKELFTKFS